MIEGFGFDIFKEMVYSLHMYKKYPNLSSISFDEKTCDYCLNELKAIVKYNYAMRKKLVLNKLETLNDDQTKIIGFFKELLYLADYPKIDGISKVKYNLITTNYDYIIETILFQIYPDFLFNMLYRGFTPKFINEKYDDHHRFADPFLINYFKLNGGFEIYNDQETNHYNISYDYFAQPQTAPPPAFAVYNEIVLPSKEQEYLTKYLGEVITKTVRILQNSKVLLIIGYGFPPEDTLFKFVIRHFGEDNNIFSDKKLIYITDNDLINDMRQKLINVFGRAYNENNVILRNDGFTNWLS